jgi:hypothetical protein
VPAGRAGSPSDIAVFEMVEQAAKLVAVALGSARWLAEHLFAPAVAVGALGVVGCPGNECQIRTQNSCAKDGKIDPDQVLPVTDSLIAVQDASCRTFSRRNRGMRVQRAMWLRP